MSKIEKGLREMYFEVLTSFCGNDRYREWMNTPFVVGNKAHSTDAYFLTIIDAEKVEGFEKLPKENAKKFHGIIPTDRNVEIEIKTKRIKTDFEKAPQIDAYDIVGEDIDCLECDGHGEVEWEYENHTKDFDCPVCDGEGKSSVSKQIKNGKTRIDDYLCVKIGNSFFAADKIEKVLKTAEKINAKNITLTYQDTPNKGSIFKLNDLEILVMPYMQNDNQKVIASYT
jgi:hypothetical protein